MFAHYPHNIHMPGLQYAKWQLMLFFFGCLSCSHNTNVLSVKNGNTYATGFELKDSADVTVAIVYSPWEKDKVMNRYVIHEQAEHIAVASCTHVGFINAIGCINKLVGVCNPELIYTPLPDGIVNLGDAMTPNKERLLATKLDAMMVSTYAHGDTYNQQLEALGIPVIYINEWVETHPLARAEWIRFVGAICGQRQKADSIFMDVCNRYDSLANLVKHVSHKTSILSGQDFRGTWYVPGGHTFMGQLFRDAAADYKYQDDKNNTSIPLNIESVIRDFASEADVWIGVDAYSLQQLSNIDNKHTWFKAYKNGEVYNFRKRYTPTGGNDFWERGVVHPDEILSDLIHILYPDIVSEETTYTERLK